MFALACLAFVRSFIIGTSIEALLPKTMHAIGLKLKIYERKTISCSAENIYYWMEQMWGLEISICQNYTSLSLLNWTSGGYKNSEQSVHEATQIFSSHSNTRFMDRPGCKLTRRCWQLSHILTVNLMVSTRASRKLALGPPA